MHIGALIAANSLEPAVLDPMTMLGDKPLLFWSIDCALESDCFSRVLVVCDPHIWERVRQCYGAQVELLQPGDDVGYLSLSWDLMDLIFEQQDIDALAALWWEYPFRNAERIRRDILPYLLAGQVLVVDALAWQSVSTFDLWFAVDCGYATVFHWYEEIVRPVIEAYRFVVRGVTGADLGRLGFTANERCLTMRCDFAESIQVRTPKDLHLAQNYARFGEPKFKPLRRTQMDRYALIAPEGVDHSSFADFLGDRLFADERPLILERPGFSLGALPLQCQLELDQAMPTTAYRALRNERQGARGALNLLREVPCYRVVEEPTDNRSRRDAPLFTPSANVVHGETLASWDGYCKPYGWPEKTEGN